MVETITPQKVNRAMSTQIRVSALFSVIQAVVMMTAAGTLDWPLGWRYLFFYLGVTAFFPRLLAPRDPALLVELGQVGPGTKSWDLLLSRLVTIAAPLAIIAVAGFDRRFGWTAPLPDAYTLGGLLTAALSMILLYKSMRANTFFSPALRIQTERGHYVASGGPYATIRHPGYAAAIIFYLCYPLMLGSLWAFIPAGLAAALLVVRTVLEDRALVAELPGYSDYTLGVRYRLIPGIW